MMHWYESAELENERQRRRTSAIKNGIEQLYEDLWGEILHQVMELKQRYNRYLYTNGSGFDRIVGVLNPLNMPTDRSPKNELHIKLEGDVITASVDRKSLLKFTAEAGTDDVVRLTYEGVEKTMQGATIMILRRFLFPDLVEPEET